MPFAQNSPGGPPRPAHVRPIALSELARTYGGRLTGGDAMISGVSAASGRVAPGDLFAGVPGHSAHGARFAQDAVAAGAVAVLTDAHGAAMVPPDILVMSVTDVRGSLGPVSSAVYGHPSRDLEVVGVTGTSGKTTTTFFVRAGFQAAGRPSGLIGTVATLIGDDAVHTGFTTPEAPDLQALLADMRERGALDVAMEVSSHALAMGRADGIEFALAAFTNLSQEHLDFHADMPEYFAAKAKLFDGRARSSVVVVDDEWGRRLADQIGEDAITVSTSGKPAAWRAVDIRAELNGQSRFRVLGPGVDVVARCAVPGAYNVSNAVLALVILERAGVSLDVAVPAVSGASVPGRMERIDIGQPFTAIVDYSHKPAAVDSALHALRPLTRGRMIVVLGCGGDRDREKRPRMGEIAARGADLLIVTDDNPRTEDPAAIRAAMLEGARSVPATERGDVIEIGDRAEAIRMAVDAAEPGDTVLLAGKGHEPGQEINGRVHPFDDREVLRAALAMP